ncbi:MAG: helix-turn-helix domain-containing protein [Caldilineaceae bacterium]|nr:helix-turn-helix domain-containing protein [Caldilineaceae bacterium]
MEQTNINESSREASYTPPPSANGSAGNSPLQTLGALLRERREQRGASLADVEKATRIRQKYLAAIEADEWHLLPGEVVGRGFLRNYANHLNLDSDTLLERRRAATDPTLARSLSRTSAGSVLPPVREVDYRPKDVDLVETPVSDVLSEYIAAGRDWFAPIATALAVIAVIVVLGWGLRQIGSQVSTLLDSLQERASSVAPEIASVNTPTLEATPAPQISSQAVDGGSGGTTDGTGGGTGGGDSTTPAGGAVVLIPTATPTPEPPTPTPEPPTPTPTETPVPLPTPTETPVPLPPTPEPVVVVEEPTPVPAPAIQSPVCPDARSVISLPGVNQVVSGLVPIIGSATHEAFNYYKLEFAPGANAEGGFVYFDGTSSPVVGGVMGRFNSPGVPNGTYTIRLIVVDDTGNYPPPCKVTVTVQN